MKKFIGVCAFALLSFAFANQANAQCCGGKKSANNTCTKSKTEASNDKNIANPDAKTVNATEKNDKKTCSDKKATNASNKNCCSSKKEARKEEGK